MMLLSRETGDIENKKMNYPAASYGVSKT